MSIPIVVPVPVARSKSSVTYMNYYPYNGYYYYPSRYNRRRYYGYYPGNTYAYTTYYTQPCYTTARNTSVMLGPLPSDFLVVPAVDPVTQRLQQEENDHAVAAQLQMMNRTQPIVGRLQIRIIRATLHKNYGMTRMDPYARIHIGQQVYETHTDPNGAKSPVWNKVFYVYQIPKSFTSFHIEIYDERSLSDDERIAWATILLPETLRQGVPSEQWYNLSGKLGDGLEGQVQIAMVYETSVAPVAAPMVVYGGVGHPTSACHLASSVPVYQVPHPPPQQGPPPVTEEDVKQVAVMFPDMEAEVIRSVLEASGNNKEAAVEALLAMQTTPN